MDSKKLELVWDRQEIEQLMYRHARSLDRMDGELMKSCYWEDGVDKEGILGGRHSFKLEKRNDEWRIMHRTTIFDWNQNQDATAVWSDKFDDKYRGKRDKSDDSYNYLSGK